MRLKVGGARKMLVPIGRPVDSVSWRQVKAAEPAPGWGARARSFPRGGRRAGRGGPASVARGSAERAPGLGGLRALSSQDARRRLEFW